MITPTSVSSRLSASPVMPWPRSIISFNIASARPSIRATPSPISRITPTFCVAAALDPHAPDQRGVVGERRAHSPAVGARDARLHARAEVDWERDGALHQAAVARAVEPDQPLEVR